MLLSEIWEFLVAFIQENFKGMITAWGHANSNSVKEIAWSPIVYWIILFIALSIIATFLLSRTKIIERLSKHILLLSFIVWFSGVLVYIVGFYNSEANGLSIVSRAIISSFKMFVVSNDLARVPQLLQNDASYMTAFSLLHLAAAFITFLFIFKMVGYKIKSSVKIFIHKMFRAKDKVVHLFWGVNEASCLLAEDIREKHPTETIIFVDIDEECEDNSQRKPGLSHITNTITIKNSEIARLDAIDALVDHCYNGPAALKGESEVDTFGTLHLNNIGRIVEKSSRSFFYFLSDDEVQNISGALNLQKDKKLCSMKANRPIIYIHARKNANNEVFDHYSQYDETAQRMKIKIVDSAYLSIAPLKQDDKALPVNCVEFDKDTGVVTSPFTALIVGFGGTGQEAFKFLYEFSAFIGPNKEKSPFKCYAIDEKMGRIAGLIKEKMPDIKETELSLIQAAVDSKEFWEQIEKIISELNYVVIALNNDTIGLSLAVNLFKYALMKRPTSHPMLKILVRCYDNGNEKRMTEVADNLNMSVEGKNVEILLYGKEKELYCCNTILSDDILEEAKVFNKVYENSNKEADTQWEINFGKEEMKRLTTTKKMLRYHAIYDINRRIAQNISNSLHSRTKMILMGFGKNELSERLKLYYGYVNPRTDKKTSYSCSNKKDEIMLQNMAMVEHERWIASHKLMGYQYNPENDYVKKYHKCICPWDSIDEETQSYDCNVVDTTIKMAYERIKKQTNIA